MPDIKKTIEEIAASFYKEALAYYLHFESSEQRLPQMLKNTLKEKYGKQIFMPTIQWIRVAGDIADSDAFDKGISNYLQNLNYDKEHFIRPKNRFINMLWNKARDDGRVIISEIIKE